MRPYVKLLSVLSLCLLLVSCSSTRISYKFLDWWLWWQIDDYVDLTKSQKSLVKEHIDQFHQWHRANELPKYSALIADIERDIQTNNFQQAQLTQHFNHAIELWQNSASELYAPLIQLMPQLSDRQVEDMLMAMKTLSDEQIESYLGDNESEAKKTRKKRLTKQVKKWLGHISEVQRQILNDTIDQMDLSSEPVISARNQWQSQFQHVIQARSEPGFNERMSQLLIHPDQLWSEDYRTRIQSNQGLSLSLSEHILMSMSDKQKNKLLKRLAKFREDFDYLASKQEKSG